MRDDQVRNEGQDRLIPLHDLKDFKVAKEDPDARGWKVIGADGERFGKVEDLIVDPRQMKVRYLDVEVDRRLFNEEYDRHLLVPIGAATLDREDDKVFVPFIDRTSLANYPVYHGGAISEEYEYSVREAILGTSDQNRAGSGSLANTASTPASTPRDTTSRPISNDFYEHEHFNENKFYSNRQDEGDRPLSTRDRDNDRDRDSVRTRDSDSSIFDDRDRDSVRNRDSDSSIFDDRDHFRDQRSTTTSSVSSSSGNAGSHKKVEESISTIERLEQLRERGSITEEEFRALKKRALDL